MSNARKRFADQYLDVNVRPKLPANVKLHTKPSSNFNGLTLNLKTVDNRNIGFVTIAFLKPGYAMLNSGKTYDNFRNSPRKYGTFLRALATKLALREPNVSTVLHEGVNKENLVARSFGLNAKNLKNIAIGKVSQRERLVKELSLNENTVKRIIRNYAPLSTKVVRKLGFVEVPNQFTGGRPMFVSKFNVGMNHGLLNAAINRFLRQNHLKNTSV